MVDSGPTHGFINERFVVNKGLEAKNFDGFLVMLADGSKMDW